MKSFWYNYTRSPQTNLIEIDDDPEGVAESKDNYDPHQDHGNALVPFLPAGGLLVQVADAGDGSVDQTVGYDQDDEGKESHEEEVCKENVVSDVARVFSHRGEANGVFLVGWVDNDFTNFEGFIPSLNTGEEFIEPGDVPDDADEYGGDSVDDAGETQHPECIIVHKHFSI